MERVLNSCRTQIKESLKSSGTCRNFRWKTVGAHLLLKKPRTSKQQKNLVKNRAKFAHHKKKMQKKKSQK